MSCWYHIRCACHVVTTSGVHDMLIPHQVCMSYDVSTTSGVHDMLVPHQEGTAIYEIGTLKLLF